MDFQFTLIYNILATFALLKYSGYLDPASASVIIAMIIQWYLMEMMLLECLIQKILI